jgi:hypothetical protein
MQSDIRKRVERITTGRLKMIGTLTSAAGLLNLENGIYYLCKP